MENSISVYNKDLKDVCNEFLAKSKNHIENIMEAYPGIERENAENLVIGWFLKDVIADDKTAKVYLFREDSLQKHIDFWNRVDPNREIA